MTDFTKPGCPDDACAWTYDKQGRFCEVCGLRRESDAPPPQRKLAKHTRGKNTRIAVSDVVVVPHLLQGANDAQVVLMREFEFLRKKQEANPASMDNREVARFKMLVGMLKELSEVQAKVSEAERDEFRKMTDAQLKELSK